MYFVLYFVLRKYYTNKIKLLNQSVDLLLSIYLRFFYFFLKKNMPIIIVHVMLNSKTVFEWEGLPVTEDMNIEEFFKDVVVYKLKPELWEKNCVAYFSHTN